ncbi:MAG: helix-turn-helix domain-containing protein [Cyanobacteria bacterium RUI128]|nr:helix-turn-helix domain-containing protein [Cyanobacteria bacterium RUI128]
MDKGDFLKLGHKIKFERSQRKISQLELSLKTGLTTRTISRIECGSIDPKYSTLKKIAEAFDIDLVKLLDFKL